MGKDNFPKVDADVFVVNGNEWKPGVVNVPISARSNYILAKLKLLHPYSARTKIAKEILDKALLEIDEKITGI